jgi:hypothetical protein
MRKGINHNKQAQPLPGTKPQAYDCDPAASSAGTAPTLQPSSSAKQQPPQQQPQQQRDRLKGTCTVSARMRQVVDQMLACDAEHYAMAMQQTTIFAFKSQQSELVLSFLQEMCRENCTLYHNKDALLQLISEAYDKTQALFAVH